jgi:3'-5' exoribonuclease
MKSAYVSDLAAGQTITSFFLVHDKELRTGSSGKPFLCLELGDRTGTIEARMWENFEEAAAGISRDDFVKVQARVDMYRGRQQLILERLRRADPAEIDPADYFPHTREDVAKLSAELRELAASVGNPWLRRLLGNVLEDPKILPLLERAPAAKRLHHAYLGGLLEHIVSLGELTRVVAARYPELDADVLLTGAVLHDIGKIHELDYERSFAYTTEGLLVGHIAMALELVTKKIEAIEGFPPRLKTLVQHLVLSHHGKLEFGSPCVPMFPEAVVLHYLDDLDSKMAAMRATLASAAGEGDWTAWNAALDRRLLRLDRYAADPARRGGPDELPSGPSGGPESGKSEPGNKE